jgi:hypothetical protein
LGGWLEARRGGAADIGGGNGEDGDANTGEFLDEAEDKPGEDEKGEAGDSSGEGAFGFLGGFFIGAGSDPLVGAENKHDEEGEAGEADTDLEEAAEDVFEIAELEDLVLGVVGVGGASGQQPAASSQRLNNSGKRLDAEREFFNHTSNLKDQILKLHLKG